MSWQQHFLVRESAQPNCRNCDSTVGKSEYYKAAFSGNGDEYIFLCIDDGNRFVDKSSSDDCLLGIGRFSKCVVDRGDFYYGGGESWDDSRCFAVCQN